MMNVGVPSRRDRHTLEWACEWYSGHKKQAIYLGSLFVERNHRAVMGDC